jgi:hypothetical protein
MYVTGVIKAPRGAVMSAPATLAEICAAACADTWTEAGERVGLVSGVGHDRARDGGTAVSRFHDVRVVVTNLAVLDFETADASMRLRSFHPGAGVSDVEAATGFPLDTSRVAANRLPTYAELTLIRDVIDPGVRRDRDSSTGPTSGPRVQGVS